MGAQLLGWVIVLGAIGGGAVFYATREKPLEVTVEPVARGRVEQTVTAIASGTVMADQNARIAAGYIGTISALHVDQGQWVNEGDLLVELSHAELDAQIALAEANLRAGEARLAGLRLGADISSDVSDTRVSQAAAQLEQARNDFQRVKALYEKQAISHSDYDKVALALRVAEEAAAAARASSRETLVRDEEILSAQATLEQLEAAVQVARAARDKAVVRAPFNGVVGKLAVEVGEATAMGMPLLTLVNTEAIYVEAPFDEANAAEIRVGQRARLNIDAYRDHDYYGTVDRIDKTITLNPDLSRTLNARILIEEGAEVFIPGMSVDVVLVVDEKDDVLYAPTETLIRQEFAYVVEGGHAVRRDIEAGVGNWSTIEIVKGLQEGDQLVTSVSLKGLGDGVPVKVVKELEGP